MVGAGSLDKRAAVYLKKAARRGRLACTGQGSSLPALR